VFYSSTQASIFVLSNMEQQYTAWEIIAGIIWGLFYTGAILLSLSIVMHLLIKAQDHWWRNRF
jgi:hypothetical protein